MADIFNRIVIDSFRGDHEFLSNFYQVVIQWRGFRWPTSEHAYQAMKCTLDEEYHLFLDPKLTAGQAKRLGRRVTTHSHWDHLKRDIMEQIVLAKFADPMLAAMLVDTGDAILIEGNTWGDTFWGVCAGKGENHLGLILMHTRGLLNDILRSHAF